MSLIIEDPDTNFKHIHRILNTNIDGKRTVPFALEKIKGVGRRFGYLICKILRINPRLRAGELNEKQCDGIASIINDPEGHGVPRWFLNRVRDYREGKNLQVASNILETKLREDIERLYKIKANRGLRHRWGLRVRGQHTKTTGRGGATVGVERKKK
jgi:small subunit ribosomal protein S18e